MVQDRLRKLAKLHGLIPEDGYIRTRADPGSLGGHTIELEFPAEIPLRLLNNYGIDLGDDEHRQMIEAEVAAVRPVMLIFDPLYLALGGVDTDRASALYPYLKWLLELSNKYSCAIALVHHFSKRPTAPGSYQRRTGQRLLGSTTLHGWVDSAIYCEQLEDERLGWVGTRVEPEFRSMSPRPPVELRLWWGEPQDLGMKVEIKKFDLTEQIVDAVRDEPGVTVVKLAERLGIDRRTVLGRARDSNLLAVTGGGGGRGHSYRLSLNGT
jgi:hypothetical protein